MSAMSSGLQQDKRMGRGGKTQNERLFAAISQSRLIWEMVDKIVSYKGKFSKKAIRPVARPARGGSRSQMKICLLAQSGGG